MGQVLGEDLSHDPSEPESEIIEEKVLITIREKQDRKEFTQP